MQFMGTWYEIFRYGNESFGAKADCVKNYFSIHHANEEPLRIETSFEVLANKDETQTYFGTASNLTEDATSWNMTMAYNGVKWTFDYQIMSTDYTNYAIAYSCEDLNDTHKAGELTYLRFLRFK